METRRANDPSQKQSHSQSLITRNSFRLLLFVAFLLLVWPTIAYAQTLDFGDAPGPYLTTSGEGGPSHVVGSVRFGAAVDAEANGVRSDDADSDDLNGSPDDEDALPALPRFLLPASPTTGTWSPSVTVPCTPNGAAVVGYLDSNGNSAFGTGAEKSLPTTCSNGSATITWNIGAGVGAQNTFLRLRIANVQVQIDSPNGAAQSGEVEDHHVIFDLPPQPTFPACDPRAFLFQELNRTDGYSVNLLTGEANEIFPNMANETNAIGFNLVDNYIWGVCRQGCAATNWLTRVGSDGSNTDIGPIRNLPEEDYNVGDVRSDGFLYITSLQLRRFYVVDLRPTSPSYLKAINIIDFTGFDADSSRAGVQIAGSDWAFHPTSGQLYTVYPTNLGQASRGHLLRINPATGAVTDLGLIRNTTDGAAINFGVTNAWGAVYFDSAGYLYISHNNSGTIHRVDTTNPATASGEYRAVLFANGPTSTQNDGARCANAALPIDLGDAPDSYGTTINANGPRHDNADTSTLRLGTVIDFESEGQPTIAANGDDITDQDDEDGVATFPPLSASSTSYQVSVQCSGSGTVAGWIDFNRNGTFESGERAAAACASTTVALSWSNLSNLAAGATYARFRIASDANDVANPTGSAQDGEVEDYALTISSIPLLEKGISPSAITAGEISNLIFTVSNLGTNTINQTGIAFIDNLPTGLRVADPPGIIFSTERCGSATVTATAGGTSIAVSNVSVPANTACTIRVQITNASTQLNPDCANLPDAFTNDGGNISGAAGPLDASQVTPSCLIVREPLLVATKVDALQVDADDNDMTSPGDTLRYTIVIQNLGDGTATNAQFSDTPGAHTQLVTNTVTTSKGTILLGNGVADSQVSIQIGDLAPDEEATITFDVRIDNPVPIGVTHVSNQGIVTVDNPDYPATVTDDPDTPEPDDPTDTPITLNPLLDAYKRSVLIGDVNGDGIINPGDRLLFSVRIINSGNATAVGVNYTDIPHPHTRLIPGSLNISQGSIIDGNDAGDTTVKVAIGDIPGGGGEVLITYQVLINNPLLGGVVYIQNQGIVTDDDPETPIVPTDDPDTPETDDPTRDPVTADPDLDATKRASLLVDINGDGRASPGDTILYTVLVVNRGNISATQVVYTDTIDPNTSMVVGSVQTSQGTIVSGNGAGDTEIEIQLGTLFGAGGQAEISYQVVIDDPLATGVIRIVNQGLVTDGDIDTPDDPTDDPDTPQNDDPTIVPIGEGAQLHATKRDILESDLDRSYSATPEDIIVYLITLSNLGNDDAVNVSFEDTPDANTSLIVGSVTTSLGTITTGNNTGDTSVSINVGTLPARGTVHISFRVSISQDLPEGVTQVANQGIVGSDNDVTPCPRSDVSTASVSCPELPTDDPDTTEPYDPTLTPVVVTPTAEEPTEHPNQDRNIFLPQVGSGIDE